MRKTTVLVTVAGLLALAACGSDNGGDEPDAGQNGNGSGGDAATELTSITVGVMPIIDTAPLYMAQESGIFEEHGLDVTLAEVQTGAAAMASVTSNEYQFGFSAPSPLVAARDTGLGVVIVAGAISQNTTLNQAIVAPEGSGIESVNDLEGKTVAVNALQGINELVTRGLVAEAGGDTSQVNFIALPYPEIQGAIEGGQVDAGWLIEPFLSNAVSTDGLEAALENPQGQLMGDDTTFSSYFANEEWAQENPDVVKAFVAAVAEANEYAENNTDEVRAAIPTFTAMSEEVAERITIGRYITETDLPTFQIAADLMFELGWIDNELDVDELIY